MSKYYTVYAKDKYDSILAFGNSLRCCKMLGLKDIRVFFNMLYNVKHGKDKRYIVVTEDDEGNMETIGGD